MLKQVVYDVLKVSLVIVLLVVGGVLITTAKSTMLALLGFALMATGACIVVYLGAGL